MDAVLNWVWQGVVVAAALFLMLRAIKAAPAGVRYTVCGVALLIVLAIPALGSLSTTSDVARYARQSSVDPVVPVPATPWTSTGAMLALWCLWAGAQGFHVSRALIGLRRTRRTCRPFPSDVEQRLGHWMRVRGEQRPARLVVSDRVARAAVLGCGTPIIAVAPTVIEHLSVDELDSVIVHEWAHVQRRDEVVNLVQLAIRVVAGWHPAVWLIDRRLRVEREVACDETAVAVIGSAKSYASCLVKLTAVSVLTPHSFAAPGVLTPGSLRYRVTRIVSNRPSSRPIRSRGLGTAAGAALLTLAAGLGSVELFAIVTTPLAPTTLMTISAISAPVESIPVRRLQTDPVPRAQDLPGQAAVAPRRGVQSVPPAPVQTALSPGEGSRPQLPIAQSHEGGDRQSQVETRDSVAAEASTVVGNPPIPDAAAPPGSDQADARSPWVAAGDAGAAIGQRSKAAGVATAGAFTRFARRVAGSF